MPTKKDLPEGRPRSFPTTRRQVGEPSGIHPIRDTDFGRLNRDVLNMAAVAVGIICARRLRDARRTKASQHDSSSSSRSVSAGIRLPETRSRRPSSSSAPVAALPAPEGPHRNAQHRAASSGSAAPACCLSKSSSNFIRVLPCIVLASPMIRNSPISGANMETDGLLPAADMRLATDIV